jgi:hypothetical protein
MGAAVSREEDGHRRDPFGPREEEGALGWFARRCREEGDTAAIPGAREEERHPIRSDLAVRREAAMPGRRRGIAAVAGVLGGGGRTRAETYLP